MKLQLPRTLYCKNFVEDCRNFNHDFFSLVCDNIEGQIIIRFGDFKELRNNRKKRRYQQSGSETKQWQ